MEDKGYKFYIEAELKPLEETISLRKEISSVIDLPSDSEKQPDLSYFTSILVSTGTNLNNAHFLASELVMAESTIPGKAVDIEHEEDKIIGHIYKCEYTDKDYNKLDISELQNKSIAEVDSQEMHVEIASVVYKTRFPEIAKEINAGDWKVSLETYFKSFDVLIGDMILSVNEAKTLGFDISNDDLYGKKAKVIKAGKVIAEGTVARVLRGLCFSGVGIVKNPANPKSVILDTTASKSTATSEDEIIILDYDKQEKSAEKKDNKVTIPKVEEEQVVTKKEKSELQYDDTVGVCVNYKKELLDSIVKDQKTKVLETEWCTKFDKHCPVTGEFTNSKCLSKAVANYVEDYVSSMYEKSVNNDRLEMLTNKLIKVLHKK